jgi:membrane-associated phospholipid phosphatase
MRLVDLDRKVLVALRTRGHQRPVERALAVYSRSGEHAAAWFALGAIGATVDRDPVRRRGWRRGLQVTAGAYALNFAVKLLVRRQRPDLAGLPPLTPVVSRLSFPSAHATTSFAAAAAYRRLVPARLVYAAAALFAFTRPYLGVHYPSDVAAGAVLGTLLEGAWPR